MSKAFAIAIYAENAKKYQVAAGTVVADSVLEAKQLGLESAKTGWPLTEGWVNHDCSAGEISLDSLLHATRTEADGSLPVPHQPVFGDSIIGNAVERLSKTDPANVQEVAASQVGLLTIYHNLVLDQARRSFKWALIAAGVGFGFFLAAVTFMLLKQPESLSTISLISGALVQVISAINFYLYSRTSAQLAEFQTRLDHTQRFLLANSVCEGLDDDHKQPSRAELVKVIAGAPESQMDSQIQSADKIGKQG
jgi:hypothetical protein